MTLLVFLVICLLIEVGWVTTWGIRSFLLVV
jgi:hypothetical protein